MSKLLSDEELRKSLKDFLKGGLLNDGTLNPNTLNTLERFINTQKRLYAESERYNWVVKGAETVVEDLGDWIKENNPNVSDIQHRISTITGHLELEKEIEYKLSAEQRARVNQ